MHSIACRCPSGFSGGDANTPTVYTGARSSAEKSIPASLRPIAHMIRGTFDGADLTDSSFASAILARASFNAAVLNGSDWRSAYLYRTNLTGADLSGVKGLEQLQIQQSCGDETTVLPAGLTAPDSWPCVE